MTKSTKLIIFRNFNNLDLIAIGKCSGVARGELEESKERAKGEPEGNQRGARGELGKS